MRGGCPTAAADGSDGLARQHPVADPDEVLLIVGIHGDEAVNVLNLHHVAVALLDAASDDPARRRGGDGSASVGPDVDAFVPATTAQPEARCHRSMYRP